MWVVEELRGSEWTWVSRPLDESEAQGALRRLCMDRPWRAYRMQRVQSQA